VTITAQSAKSSPEGSAALEHVVTVVLKQAKDGLLAKALAGGGMHEILDVLSLHQPASNALTYQCKWVLMVNPYMVYQNFSPVCLQWYCVAMAFCCMWYWCNVLSSTSF